MQKSRESWQNLEQGSGSLLPVTSYWLYMNWFFCGDYHVACFKVVVFDLQFLQLSNNFSFLPNAFSCYLERRSASLKVPIGILVSSQSHSWMNTAKFFLHILCPFGSKLMLILDVFHLSRCTRAIASSWERYVMALWMFALFYSYISTICKTNGLDAMQC